MKIRVMGTRTECTEFVDELSTILRIDGYTVKSVSEYCPNRGKSIEGRVYIEIE